MSPVRYASDYEVNTVGGAQNVMKKENRIRKKCENCNRSHMLLHDIPAPRFRAKLIEEVENGMHLAHHKKAGNSGFATATVSSWGVSYYGRGQNKNIHFQHSMGGGTPFLRNTCKWQNFRIWPMELNKLFSNSAIRSRFAQLGWRSSDHCAFHSYSQQRDRTTTAPPGTAPKEARRDMPLV